MNEWSETPTWIKLCTIAAVWIALIWLVYTIGTR